MPLYEDDFKDALKTFQQHQKDLQPTKKELEEQEKKKRQAALLKATTAEKKSGGNGLLDKAKKLGVGAKDTAIDLAKSIRNDVGDAARTARDTSQLTVEAGRAITGAATGNEDAENAALVRATANKRQVENDGIFSKKAVEGGITSKAGIKDVAKGGLRYGQYALPELKVAKGGSKLLKVGKKLAFGSATNTGLEAANELIDSGKLDADQLKKSALLGAVLPAASSAVDKGLKKVSNKVLKKTPKPKPTFENKTPKGLVDDPTGIDNVAEDLTNEDRKASFDLEAEGANVDGRKEEFNNLMAQRAIDNNTPSSQKLLPASTTGKGARTLDKIDKDIQKLQVEGDSKLSNGQVKEKFIALQEERAQAIQNEAETGFTMRRDEQSKFASNGLPNDPTEARGAIDNLDANPPETAMTADTPVQSATEIFSHENMPTEIRGAATQLLDDRGKAEQVLSGLMTKDKADAAHAQMDKAYKDREAQIAEMPAPRQEIEYQKLDEQYQTDITELDAQLREDAPQVEQYQSIVDHLDDKESQLVEHSNMLMRDNPDVFKRIDSAEMASQRSVLEQNLEQAERFNNPEKIVADVAEGPNPELQVERDPNVREAYRTELHTDTRKLDGFKSVTGVRGAMLGLMSPSHVLEKMGLRRLHADVVRAESNVNIHNQTDVEAISQIAEKLNGNDELGDQIVDYLEGTRRTISATDTETANLVKAFLDEKKSILEGVGYKTLDDYFPHIFDKGNPETIKLFKGKVKGDINFGNVKERKGNGGDYSRDIVDVLMQYSRGFNRKVYLEPALKPLEDIKVQETVTKAEAEWVDDYINQLKGITEPSAAEKLYNGIVDKALGSESNLQGSNHYRTTLGAQRMISAVATMGLNPGTAIRNLTQAVNTVAGIGAKYTSIGVKDGTRALMAGPKSPEWKEMIESGVFDGGVSKNYQSELQQGSQLRSKTIKTANKATEVMMSMVRGTDVTLRAHAYWGAKALAKSKGLSEKEARTFAINKVVDTQFITSAADMPVKLNGPGIRSLTQLATFSGKQAELLARMGVKLIKKEDGSWGINPTEAINLLSAGAAAGLTTVALKPLIGFNATEFVPFYDNIKTLTDPDSTADESIYRSPIVSLFAGNGKGKIGLLDAVKTGKMDEFLKDNWSSIVPAGTQAKKTYEGIKTTSEGVSKNDKGNVRFLQSMTGNDKLKAAFFGQYSTNEGQDWIKKGFPTLSDSQMRLGEKEGSGEPTFDQLPRETQKLYYDYYSTANQITGRGKAVDAIKQAAKEGNINKAARLGQEFNSKVQDTMSEYFKEHNQLPDNLQNDLLDKLYVDVGKQIDNATS